MENSNRPRRMRKDEFSRRLMREHHLTTDDLIYPVFVMEGNQKEEAIPSMPGIKRQSMDLIIETAKECFKLGIPAIALFPVIDAKLKTEDAKEAYNSEGLIPRVVALLKEQVPQLGVITDVALDPYTSHGQDGLLDDTGYILNDETTAVLVQQALTQARAGVDIISFTARSQSPARRQHAMARLRWKAAMARNLAASSPRASSRHAASRASTTPSTHSCSLAALPLAPGNDGAPAGATASAICLRFSALDANAVASTIARESAAKVLGFF